MRPVNLIPGEQRRGAGAFGRRPAGPGAIAAYGLLGLLGLAVVAVLALVLSSNSINDRKSSIAALEREEAGARAAAESLRPYGNFAQIQRTRVETINSLVDSAFNWERVLRQLSRTIPSDVWLTGFKGTVTPSTKVEGGGETGELRGQAPHPAVELSGCTYSHRAVARMMTRMRNLDDVTEVVLNASERPEGQIQQSAGGGGEQSEGDSSSDCRTSKRITKWGILVVLGESKIGEPLPVTGGSGAATPIAGAQAAVTTAGERNASTAGTGE